MLYSCYIIWNESWLVDLLHLYSLVSIECVGEMQDFLGKGNELFCCFCLDILGHSRNYPCSPTEEMNEVNLKIFLSLSLRKAQTFSVGEVWIFSGTGHSK